MKRGLLPVLGLLGLVWALVGPALSPVDRTDRRLCMTQLDVGQGDAILLELPGEVWLVDGGGAPGSRRDVGVDVVVPALRRRGLDRIDRVILTHGDGDHIGGLFAVLEQLEVGALIVPTRTRPSSAERLLLGLAARRGVEVGVVDEGLALEGLPGAVSGALLHPLPGWSADDPDDRNAGSVVFHLGLGAVTFLLTGDIEAASEAHLVNSGGVNRATVLKLAHHGSKSSTTPAFLEAVDPLLAVAGAGVDNRYGFPHQPVRARLLDRGTPLFWTGADGEIRVCTDGFEVTVDRTHPDAVGRPRRVYAPHDVAIWASRPRVAPTSHSEVTPAREPVVRRPRTMSSRSSRPRAARKQSAKSSQPTSPTPEPPPVLVDDKAWKKRRAKSLRAPWK